MQINIGKNIEILDRNYGSQQVIGFLKQDLLDKMSDWEIKARTNFKISTKKEYLNEINKSITDFDNIKKDFVLKCTKKAIKKLSMTDSFENLPFKFAYLSGSIDWGYTYTVGDIIVLRDRDFYRDEDNMTNLIIHEYCHIYQRFSRYVSKSV